MSEPVSPLDAKPPSPRQVLLGLFILFQLAFLLMTNSIGFVKTGAGELPEKPAKLANRVVPKFVDETGHGWKWLAKIESGFEMWTQLTGQDQEWALFAPSVTTATGFPCLMLLFDEMPPEASNLKGSMLAFDAKNGWHSKLDESAQRRVLLHSENEPADINHYFRIGQCRLRRYEGQLYVNPRPRSSEAPAETAARFTESVKHLRNQYGDVALAYMKMRLHAWQQEHSDEAGPTQIILCQRFYRIHGPDEPLGWDGPQLMPLLRWQRSREAKVLEPFDYTEERFIP